MTKIIIAYEPYGCDTGCMGISLYVNEVDLGFKFGCQLDKEMSIQDLKSYVKDQWEGRTPGYSEYSWGKVDIDWDRLNWDNVLIKYQESPCWENNYKGWDYETEIDD